MQECQEAEQAVLPKSVRRRNSNPKGQLREERAANPAFRSVWRDAASEPVNARVCCHNFPCESRTFAKQMVRFARPNSLY